MEIIEKKYIVARCENGHVGLAFDLENPCKLCDSRLEEKSKIIKERLRILYPKKLAEKEIVELDKIEKMVYKRKIQ